MLLKEQYEANRQLASVRVSVEHAFKHIARYWTYTAFAKGLCPSNQLVAAYFLIAVLLTNCYKCF